MMSGGGGELASEAGRRRSFAAARGENTSGKGNRGETAHEGCCDRKGTHLRYRWGKRTRRMLPGATAVVAMGTERVSESDNPAAVAGEPCCCRRRTLPLIHRGFWPPPELLPGLFESVAVLFR
ncbi:uncharacterized protein DS421_2g54480 [Arachis hypogaea]|nr:uncharacterized protein DS421_2g54480 [Arachis hypogaea]